MIHFYTGKPRGGKTYAAIKQIVHELQFGTRFIVSNIEIDLPALAEFIEREFSEVQKDTLPMRRLRVLTADESQRFWLFPGPNQEIRETITIRDAAELQIDSKRGGNRTFSMVVPDLTTYHELPGVLYVIDEVHMLYPARAWQSFPSDGEYFFAQHGKLFCDVILISQHPEQVDKLLRRLVQDWSVFRNMGNEPLMGFRFAGWCRRATYLQPPMSGQCKPIEKGRQKFDFKRFGSLYRTNAGVGISGRTEVRESSGRGKSPLLIPVYIIAAFALLWFGLPYARAAMKSTLQRGLGGSEGEAVSVSGMSKGVVSGLSGASQPVEDATVARPAGVPGAQLPVDGLKSTNALRIVTYQVLPDQTVWVKFSDGSTSSTFEGLQMVGSYGVRTADGRFFRKP